MPHRVALITGAGRGIGRSIAICLARQNIAIVINGRNERHLDSVAEEIRALDVPVAIVAADLAEASTPPKLLHHCIERFGHLDILVNNAAIPGPQCPLEHCKTEDWDHVMAINLRAPFLCAKAAIPQMLKRGFGRIINLVSGAGIHPMPNSGPYGVSKAGLIMLSRILSAEHAAQGISVNCIAPGLVMTPMIEENLEKVSQDNNLDAQAFIQATLKATHFNHIQRPTLTQEVAATVAFLVSDQAPAITGEVINLGGGWVAG